jgi:hypothetical protein
MKKATVIVLIVAATVLSVTRLLPANGGPFVVKYPDVDPAAKGVFARLDPDLKPGRESRLRVVKEDLKIIFTRPRRNSDGPPIASVSAKYSIENPTNEEIEIDFGFPILRGVYIAPSSMMLLPPAVTVQLENEGVQFNMISNSAIYGMIRQRSRDVIERAVSKDKKLAELVSSVRSTQDQARAASRVALSDYLTKTMGWDKRNAVLMVEYSCIDFGELKSHPVDRGNFAGWGLADKELQGLMNANLGPLSAIGEQKATQFFAQLAGQFDAEAAAGYERIFTAWGGDVRERSIDLKTGEIRPREITVATEDLNNHRNMRRNDPTIYARVDYLDPKAKISESEKVTCKAILKNLPVIFTFAPMNILHYCVKFPAKSTQKLTVSYRQHAYKDTGEPSSYQLAYVVHPASMWDDFGNIYLEVGVPKGVPFRSSAPCESVGVQERESSPLFPQKVVCDIHKAMVTNKTDELILAIDAQAWHESLKQQVAVSASVNPSKSTQKATGR